MLLLSRPLPCMLPAAEADRLTTAAWPGRCCWQSASTRAILLSWLCAAPCTFKSEAYTTTCMLIQQQHALQDYFTAHSIGDCCWCIGSKTLSVDTSVGDTHPSHFCLQEPWLTLFARSAAASAARTAASSSPLSSCLMMGASRHGRTEVPTTASESTNVVQSSKQGQHSHAGLHSSSLLGCICYRYRNNAFSSVCVPRRCFNCVLVTLYLALLSTPAPANAP